MENMQLGIALETELFLLSVVLGAALGVVADIVRVARALLYHPKALVFVEDFAYVLLFGFALYTFCTGLTGPIRGFALVGMVLGALLERLSFGNAIVYLLRKVLETLKKLVFSPIGRFMTKIGGFIKRRFVKKCLNFKRNKKNDEKPLQV